MELIFETDYHLILKKINAIDPLNYGKTRNYINGAVTYLSPYISRGVISTQQVLQIVLKKGYPLPEIEPFIKELCWRDYFQRVWQVKNLNTEIKQTQSTISNYQIPSQVVNASTGIEGIDIAIQDLYKNGYMHNHCRMYTASIVCNLAQSHWYHPAKWMFYHLLDGDWDSNACSWQWVAGANSNKKYYANQENINKYTFTNQHATFLDTSYENLSKTEVPPELKNTQKLTLQADLPKSNISHINPNLPSFIYNYYNLDPIWHQGEVGNRILLLEPDMFSEYPISKKCIQFMMSLCKNIPNLLVYQGSFASLIKDYNLSKVIYKEHPLNQNYIGTKEERDWIVKDVMGYFPSFFAYWKKSTPYLSLNFKS